MIKSITHKGLANLFFAGIAKGVQQDHKKKLKSLLLFLDTLDDIQSLLIHPKYRHSLKGDLKDFHSMTISGNWRLIFEFNNGDVYLVDYLDYHKK